MIPVVLLVFTRIAQATIGYAVFRAAKGVVETGLNEAKFFNRPCTAREKYYLLICHACKNVLKSERPIEMEQPHCPKCGSCDEIEFHETSKKVHDMMTRQSWVR